MTQAELAEHIGVTAKAVSKWETGKGLPDVTLLEPLAQALRVSLSELLSGSRIVNRNVSCNVRRMKFFVCPVCGNVLTAMGDASLSCCGVAIPAIEAEETDPDHEISVERVEDEIYVSLEHPMTKEHYISFLACVTSDSFRLVKLYPEGPAATRFKLRGSGELYAFCNRHGLFRKRY